MTIQQAIKVLKEHNNWRRGVAPYDDRNQGVMPFSPREIGMAIEVLIKFAEEKQK